MKRLTDRNAHFDDEPRLTPPKIPDFSRCLSTQSQQEPAFEGESVAQRKTHRRFL